ncbi:MAG: site-2 protease family protein [Bryobacterales bacterium]|nr:site-2 protease family protein [Bryobacterales bacterium]
MFGKKFKIFKLLGFEVHIDASWLILALLVVWSLARGYFPFRYPGLESATYWWMGVAGALGLFLSIVIHEFSHSLVARRRGLPMRGITLFIFGGVAEMSAEPPSAATEFRMAIAGPIVSVGLGIVSYLIHSLLLNAGASNAVTGIFLYLGFINIALAVFNMIPAFPLDGGRVLRAYLWSRRGDMRSATRTAAKLGSGFGALLIALGAVNVVFGNFIGGMWWFLIGLFLRGASTTSYEQLEVRKALEGEPISRFMTESLVTVPPSTRLPDLVEGYFYRYHHRMFPVVGDDGHLIGCVSTQDLKAVPREEWYRHTAGEIAESCSHSNTVTPETDAMEALGRMTRGGQSRLLVARDGRLLGMVTLKDLLNFLAIKLDLESGPRQISHIEQVVGAPR